MIIDSRILPAEETIEADVCIVGAGSAGITLAREFAEQDFRVCLLESGGFELPDETTRSLGEVESDGTFVQVLPENRNRRFGGNAGYWGVKLSHTQNGVRLIPFEEVDFEKRDWLPHSGWSFDRQHLDPYYERAQAIMGAGPYAYDTDHWTTEETPQLPFKTNRVKTSMFMFGNGQVFTQQYRIEIDRAPNITVYCYANALELETDASGQTVNQVRVGTLQGNRFWVSAKIVLLAAGGVENTHLLMLSNKTHQNGIGNEYDLLGRFFMDHPIVHGGTIVPFDRQIFNKTALYDMRDVNGTHVLGGLTLTKEVMYREQALNIASWIFPRPRWFPDAEAITSLRRLTQEKCLQQGATGFFQDIKNVLMGMDELVDAAYGKLTKRPDPFWANLSTGNWSQIQQNKERAYGVFEVLHLVEQVPHPDNRLMLGEGIDALGRRRIHLQSSWQEADLQGIDRAQAILAEELAQSGIGRFKPQRGENGELLVSSLGASHHMGTTRMDHDRGRALLMPTVKFTAYLTCLLLAVLCSQPEVASLQH